MFLQSIGLLPDNIIILSSSRDKVEKRVADKLKANLGNPTNVDQLVKESVDQYELNLDSVRAIYKGFFSELKSQGKDASIEEIGVNFIFLK